jgi:hypothetical protein
VIEANERGIVISKGLAWTIITGIALGGIWYGREQTETKNLAEAANRAVVELKLDLDRETHQRNGLGERIRDMELVVTRQDERLGLILTEITKLSTKFDQFQENTYQK